MKQLLKELGVVVGAIGLMGYLLISFSMMVSALEKDTIQLELYDRISCAGKDKKMLRYTLYVPEGTLKQSYNLDLVTNK